jgi:hypothetical protein
MLVQRNNGPFNTRKQTSKHELHIVFKRGHLINKFYVAL